MFANLNLQLTSLLASADTGLAGAEDLAITGFQNSEGTLSFSEFFSTSTEEAELLVAAEGEFLPPDGEFLPPDGKPLPPTIPLPETAVPDLLNGAAEERHVRPELPPKPTTLRPDADLPDVQLDLTLDYSGNEIATEFLAEIPDGVLVLPPGLTLTAIIPGPTDTTRIPPDDFLTSPYKDPRPAALVPPGPPLTTPGLQLETTEDLLESAPPHLPVSALPRERRGRLMPQTPLAASTFSIDTNTTGDLRPVAEVAEIVRQIAAVEPQRQPEPQLLSASVSAPPAAVNLGAPPYTATTELNALRTELPVETISTPVREPSWGEKLAQRVVVLAGVQTKTAEIRLTPAELGPLRVQISVDDGQTHVAFQAHNAVTREAIEQALPRLREMLAESGLSLGQADVGEQGVAGGDRDREATADGPVDAQGDTQDERVGSLEGRRQESVISNGLVDTFA